MIVVSYYTDPYESHAMRLAKSLDRFSIQHDIRRVPDGGSWRANCGLKPTYIINALDVWQERVLWLDADATVEHDLKELPTAPAADFSAWFIPNRHMRKADLPAAGADGIASGTMLFAPTPGAYGLLLLWQAMEEEDRASQQPVEYEQIILGRAWLRYHARVKSAGLRTRRLPQRYCKVFDSPWFDGEKGPAVILHHQASRTLKRRARS